MAGEFGVDPAGMDRGCAEPARPVAPVELDGKEDVRRFRAAVGDERIVGRPLEVRVVEVDVGAAMPGGRQIDEPPARSQELDDPVHQHEVAEVICPELSLEPVRGLAERGRHHAGVGDDDVESPPVVEERVG